MIDEILTGVGLTLIMLVCFFPCFVVSWCDRLPWCMWIYTFVFDHGVYVRLRDLKRNAGGFKHGVDACGTHSLVRDGIEVIKVGDGEFAAVYTKAAGGEVVYVSGFYSVVIRDIFGDALSPLDINTSRMDAAAGETSDNKVKRQRKRK